jgi:hypothetical protein
MPDVDAMFAKLSGYKFSSRLDLSKRCSQVPITQSTHPCTAFQSLLGLFQFPKVSFVLVTASVTFSCIMQILHNRANVNNFIGILVYTETFEQHVQLLFEVLMRLREANLADIRTKCSVGYRKLECLGHIIGDNQNSAS